MSRYLHHHGKIPSSDILTYTIIIHFVLLFFRQFSSFDTIGDVFYVRTVFTEARRLCKLLIITSEFHMERTKLLFEWIMRLPLYKHAKPASFCAYSLQYMATENAELTDDMLQSRLLKEQRAIQSIDEMKRKIHSMEELNQWLFSEHKVSILNIFTLCRPIVWIAQEPSQHTKTRNKMDNCWTRIR